MSLQPLTFPPLYCAYNIQLSACPGAKPNSHKASAGGAFTLKALKTEKVCEGGTFSLGNSILRKQEVGRSSKSQVMPVVRVETMSKVC